MDTITPSLPAIITKSQWIWPGHPNWDLNNCFAQFRKDFFLKKVPSQAPLVITADLLYHLYLNGRFVCRGPARGFHGHWPFDEIDVTQYLRQGHNVIAIRAFNPGCSSASYISAGTAGVLV